MSKAENEGDILENLKKIDKAVKAKVLIEEIARIKSQAKQVLEIKSRINARLESLGVAQKDQKRIIDYVNELPEVKLTEGEVEKIRIEASASIKKLRSDMDESIRGTQLPELLNRFYDVNNAWNGVGSISNGNTRGEGILEQGGGSYGGSSVGISDLTYQYAGNSGISGTGYILSVANGTGIMKLKM